MKVESRFLRGLGVAMTLAMCTGLVTLALATASGASSKAAVKPHKTKPPTPYYLALGDSLSVGWQPIGTGPCPVSFITASSEECTTQGYTNDLYSFYKKGVHGLKFEELGCPGETTATLISGGICSYTDRNQLAQAESFIESNDVALITIDIGANDVDGCAGLIENQVGGGYDPDQDADVTTCVVDGMTPSTPVDGGAETASQYGVGTVEGMNGTDSGEAGMNADIATIMSGLESAVATAVSNHIDTGAPPIYGMNLYNPFLAAYNDLGETALALWSVEGPCSCAGSSLMGYFNSSLANDFSSNGAAGVADVADAFSTFDTSTVYNYTPATNGDLDLAPATYPRDVNNICLLTWMCSIAANIHANKTGYGVIAGSFEQVIGYLP